MRLDQVFSAFSELAHFVFPIVFEIGRLPLIFLRSDNYDVRFQKNMLGDVRSQEKCVETLARLQWRGDGQSVGALV